MRLSLVLILAVLSGCCSLKSYEDLRDERNALRAENEKLQMFLAGKDEDNAALQKYGIALQDELMRWQFGSMLQAKREADLRSGCDI